MGPRKYRKSKKQKKRKLNKMQVLALLLMLVGLGIMFYPKACDFYYRKQMSAEIAKYNKVLEPDKEDYAEEWAAAEEYNRQLAAGEDIPVPDGMSYSEYMEQFLNVQGIGMMGYIDIPAIDVNIPIYQGIEESVLQAGAGHWQGTSLPTGGPSTHCVLTAHNGLVKAKMFTDLDQLVEGDIFSLHVLNRDMYYEVEMILIAEPDDISALKIIEGEDWVTLYTCYPYGVNSHRLLVQGHRTEKPIDVDDGGFGDFDVSWDKLWWAALLIPVAAAAGYLYEKYRYHGKHERPPIWKKKKKGRKR